MKKTLFLPIAVFFSFLLFPSCQSEKEPLDLLVDDMCAELRESVKQTQPKRMDLLFTSHYIFKQHEEAVEQLRAEKKVVHHNYSNRQIDKLIGVDAAFRMVEECDAIKMMMDRVYAGGPEGNPALNEVVRVTELWLHGRVPTEGLGYNALFDEFSSYIVNLMFEADGKLANLIREIYGEGASRILSEYETYLMYHSPTYLKLTLGKLVEVND